MLEKAWLLPTHSPREGGGTYNWPHIHFNSGAKEGGWLGWSHAERNGLHLALTRPRPPGGGLRAPSQAPIGDIAGHQLSCRQESN